MQPHLTESDICTAKFFLPVSKLIKLHNGILAYKVNSSKHLLCNFITTDGHVDRHYQLIKHADIIPLHATTHAQLFMRCRAIAYAAHRPFIVLKTNLN